MIIDNALYRDGSREPIQCDVSDLATVRDQVRAGTDDFTWVGLHQPTEEELAAVSDIYGLHDLAVEDAFNAHQRPKLERYDDTLFLVLKTLWYVDENDAVETGELNLFVGRDFVVSVRHGSGAALTGARPSLEEHQHVLRHGPSAVVYAICDEVVDQYERVASSLVEDVDEVEASVFSEKRTNDSRRIYLLKRELGEMRRAVLPLREPMNRFANGSVGGVSKDASPYFRDVSDHLARVAETVDGLDGLLSTAFDAHIAAISVQQNEDMRRLSALVAIAAVPTIFTGFFGMNFEHIPGLGSTAAFWGLVAAILICCGVLYVIFKRIDWI